MCAPAILTPHPTPPPRACNRTPARCRLRRPRRPRPSRPACRSTGWCCGLWGSCSHPLRSTSWRTARASTSSAPPCSSSLARPTPGKLAKRRSSAGHTLCTPPRTRARAPQPAAACSNGQALLRRPRWLAWCCGRPPARCGWCSPRRRRTCSSSHGLHCTERFDARHDRACKQAAAEGASGSGRCVWRVERSAPCGGAARQQSFSAPPCLARLRAQHCPAAAAVVPRLGAPPHRSNQQVGGRRRASLRRKRSQPQQQQLKARDSHGGARSDTGTASARHNQTRR